VTSHSNAIPAVNGSGVQFNSFHRWGDYSSMSVDPTDDCTFWYTQEYYATTGSFNWATRIGSFKFNSCKGAQPVSWSSGRVGDDLSTKLRSNPT